MKYIESRVFLSQISSKLTASSAQILFKSRLPLCRHKVLMDGGAWEQINQDKSSFIMYLCSPKLKMDIEDTIQFIIKSEDITDKLVNESEYVFKPSVIKEFDYVKFEKVYIEQYLEKATVQHARTMIQALGDKSRYIDHKLLLSRGLKS